MTSKELHKDLFSKQSSEYAKFRPTYPPKLFAYLSSISQKHQLAWDCGTGNGQAALALTEYFDRILATDPSAKQLANATRHPKIQYLEGSAEKATLDDHSVDLITVAQAFHWFQQDRFFSECQRVLKPSGILAIWCYELCKITPEVDQAVLNLYRDVLGPYWEKERKLVEEGYRHVQLPFEEIYPPRFEMTAQWSFEHLIGYLSTWSALNTYQKTHGENPLETFVDSLRNAWGASGSLEVKWELSVRIGKKA